VSVTDGLTESALVVPVPEADPLIDTWRRELDPGRRIGAPAHITLLFPFAPPAAIDTALLARVASVLAPFRAFAYALDSVEWFGTKVVYLAPSPPDGFVALTEAMQQAFPDYPRYGGAHHEVVPHVTIGEDGDPARMQEAAAAVRRALPIRCRAGTVDLLAGTRDADSWRLIRRFALP
jgi:2'-5' RNA ligase